MTEPITPDERIEWRALADRLEERYGAPWAWTIVIRRLLDALEASEAAIRDVLVLHRVGAEAMGYDEEGVLDYLPACAECGHAMPCPTRRAVTTHIDTSPEETP